MTDSKTETGLRPHLIFFIMISRVHIAILLAGLLLVLPQPICSAKVRHYKVKVIKEYVHDTGAYTQGLFFYGGDLYESTGQYGKSSFRKVELSSGRTLRKLDFNRKYFGEGSVILGDKMYMLTWTNKVAFIYDAATLQYRKTVSYPREGWGLTTDGKQLIASDGSPRLYFMDSEMNVKRTVNVTFNGKPLRYLNELEWIESRIWANVYTTDMIVVIDPNSGNVEGVIDCSGLLPDKLRKRDTDVLNGIARNPSDGRIYLTGKNWPRLYQIELVEQK